MIENASWGRRILALLVDSTICGLVVIAFVGWDDYQSEVQVRYWAIPVYIFGTALMTWIGGGSLGKLLTGLCVVPADGQLRRLSLPKLVVRQALALLIIPPLVFRPDGRGLHDLFAGTSTVTFATLRTLTK